MDSAGDILANSVYRTVMARLRTNLEKKIWHAKDQCELERIKGKMEMLKAFNRTLEAIRDKRIEKALAKQEPAALRVLDTHLY